MTLKPLSINGIRYKMLDWHESKFTIRRAKSLSVREFSWTIFDFIHENVCYMEADIKNILQTKPTLVKAILILRHINGEHL
jgi:hypothetical protein